MKSSLTMRLLSKLSATILLMMAAAWTTFAQTSISGKVTDESGLPLPGVAVFLKGDKTHGTSTDANGEYAITVNSGSDVLVFSCLGYKDKEVAAGKRSKIDITIEEDATKLNEIVVVGYATQRKQFVVGSVSQVNSKELIKAPMTNVSNLMTGKLPGLTTIQRSGKPGADEASITIRGYSTFTDSSPLTLVDGVPRAINTLNPNDIASISVLKDAATSAIYGVRGANGVILVTTKSGSEGKPKLTYDGSVTFTKNTAMPELLNASDYIGWHNKARELDGLDPLWTDATIQKMKEDGIYGETDWLDLLFKNHGFTHQHNISATGGNARTTYYVSLGYLDQDGIVDNTSYKRYNVRSNVKTKIAENLNLSLNITAYQDKYENPGLYMNSQNEFNPISQAIYAIPIIAPTYDGMAQGYYDGSYTEQPVAAIEQSGYQHQRQWRFEGNARLEYDFKNIPFLQGLKASLFGSYDYGNTLNRSFLHSYQLRSFNTTTMSSDLVYASGIGTTSTFTKSNTLGDTYMIRPSLSYERTFGKHMVTGLLLYEQQKNYSDNMTGVKNGYYAEFPVDLANGNSWEGISVPVSGTYGYSSMASVAGRATYAYDERYLAEFSFREDGSYKFAPENRWGFFPSLALGWVASKERFFQDALPAIDYLKFRASYGELGSDDTSPYLYMQSYSTTAPSYAYILGGNGKTAFYTTNYVYKDLTWSRTHSWNFGFEMDAWKGLLGIEFDWFYKVTSDILESVSGSYAPSLGGNVPGIKNSGKVDNRGFELVLKHAQTFNSGWNYSLRGTLSWAHNRVLSKQISDDHPMYRAILGKTMGTLYGFKAIGLYQTQEDIDNSPTAPSGTKRLGDIMYADINGDGKIDAAGDFVKIGNPYMPEFNFSLSMDVGYKNLYLSALWQGVAKCSYQLSAAYNSGVFDNTMYTRPFYHNGNAPYYLVENAWRPDHTDAKYPRLSTIANGNNAWPSTWWVKNGSYLRLKNLQLGYEIPQQILRHTGIDGLRVYLAGTNLLTFSSFKYVDPEMPSVNNGYYPQQKTYSFGLNITF